MRFGIVGSRRFPSPIPAQEFVKSLSQGSIIISGGCRGPDLWAEEVARSLGLAVNIFLPDLPPNGSPKSKFTEAYYARNRLIVENSDVIHAFVCPERKGGTEYTIKYAQKIGVPVVIHT